jgi:hypothetical protein
MKSTLFPKITTNPLPVRMAINKYARKGDDNASIREVSMVGTTKIHGTHCDIVIDALDNITFQSRHVANLTIEADSYGFAAKMTPMREVILLLKKQILKTFKGLYTVPVREEHPVVIAGEFVGENIMKNVAINLLPQVFVILVVSVNGRWQNVQHYGHIHNEPFDIYNISRGGFFYRTLNLIEPKETLEEMMVLTRGVEYQCPFALSFGIVGAGEGVVWRPTTVQHDPDMWLKTKGESFMTRPRTSYMPKELRPENKKVLDFSKIVLTKERYYHGIAYMNETGLPILMGNMETFIEWVTNDVLVEEKWAIITEGIDVESLKKVIVYHSKRWYYKKQSKYQVPTVPDPFPGPMDCAPEPVDSAPEPMDPVSKSVDPVPEPMD